VSTCLARLRIVNGGHDYRRTSCCYVVQEWSTRYVREEEEDEEWAGTRREILVHKKRAPFSAGYTGVFSSVIIIGVINFEESDINLLRGFGPFRWSSFPVYFRVRLHTLHFFPPKFTWYSLHIAFVYFVFNAIIAFVKWLKMFIICRQN
jgi:hypothetical protein